MRFEKNIKQYLEGTKYEKYIPNLYQKGISEIEDIRDLKNSGNLIQTLNEIIENKEDIIGLKDFLQTCLDNAGLKLLIPMIGIILLIGIIIFLA